MHTLLQCKDPLNMSQDTNNSGTLKPRLELICKDFTLYNETFAGMVWPILRCTNCSSEYHKSHECPIAPISAPTYTEPRARYTTPGHSYSDSRKELCGLYNSRVGNQGHYQPCRHLHICAVCHEYGHPASTCKYSGTLAKRPRVDTKPTRNT